MIALQTYFLALTAALYLLRGMVELPTIGWRPEVKATVGVGVIVLPTLAALATARFAWGYWVILSLSIAGFAINLFLLVRFWRGPTTVAGLTMTILGAYAAVIALVI